MTPFLAMLITIAVSSVATAAIAWRMKQGALRAITILIVFVALTMVVAEFIAPDDGNDGFGYGLAGLAALFFGLPLTIVLVIIFDQWKRSDL